MLAKLLGVAGLLLVSTSVTARSQNALTGDWLVEDKSIRVRVISCPPALWGYVAAERTPGKDMNNPDPAMRGRPMLGVPLLINLHETEQGLWAGKIYDPKGTAVTAGGKQYDVTARLTPKGQLEVRGCMGKIFCGGQDWTKVTDPATPPVPSPTPVFAGPAATTPAKLTKPGAQSAPDPACSSIAAMVPKS